MIKTKVDKTGHSPIAAARKHAKFLRDELGQDYLSAVEETLHLFREARDIALQEVIEDDVTGIGYVIAKETGVIVTVSPERVLDATFFLVTAGGAEEIR